MAILIGTLLPIRVGMLFWHLYLLDASQEPLKLANEPITRNMARRYQAKLNLWAQEEVTRRIQDQSSMLMEDELKESTKFINILEVIMENREERPNFEIHPSLA